MDERLSIAVQKSGRLSEKSLELIRSCGIDFYADSRVLKASASGFPLDFLFVRDDDIPKYVSEGIADIGIVGRNEYDEICIKWIAAHGGYPCIVGVMQEWQQDRPYFWRLRLCAGVPEGCQLRTHSS